MRLMTLRHDRRWIRIACLPVCTPYVIPAHHRRHQLAFEYTMSRYMLKLRLRFARKLIPALAAGMLTFGSLTPARAASGGIAMSIRDFSEASWARSSKTAKHGEVSGVCNICHQAHNIGPPIVPLWSHETSVGPFTTYSSPTLKAEVGLPNGSSLACLSCHDGTVAVNQVAGKRLIGKEAATIPPESLVPTDLHTVHPVSFVYDSTLAAHNGSLEDPTVYRIGDAKSDLTVSVPPVPAA